MTIKFMSKIWILLSGLCWLFVVPISALAQDNKDSCRVYIVNHKELQEISPNDPKEDDGTPIPQGVTVLSRFSPKVSEEERTTRTFDFPGKKLKIIASVYYTDEAMRTKLTWNSVQLSLMIADIEKKDTTALVRDTFAEFPYLPYSRIKAATNLLTEEGIYSVVIECSMLKDESTAKEYQKEFCKPKSKNDSEKKQESSAKKKNQSK